jgi:hypothetical protein
MTLFVSCKWDLSEAEKDNQDFGTLHSQTTTQRQKEHYVSTAKATTATTTTTTTTAIITSQPQ